MFLDKGMMHLELSGCRIRDSPSMLPKRSMKSLSCVAFRLQRLGSNGFAHLRERICFRHKPPPKNISPGAKCM
jgi:hypothetical protein